MFKPNWRMGAAALAGLMAASVANAQVEASQSLLGWLKDAVGFAVPMIILLLVIVGIGAFIMKRQGQEKISDSYIEPEPESSKFEQLLAEIQGLYLRVHGGESKGSYRKIEMLARGFLERLGYKGARKMSEEEIHGVLNGGALSPNLAGALGTILERCKLGGEHEGQKLDFTAADLLKDLRGLIVQAEATPPDRAPSAL
jgi:hypothetical protein